MLRYILALGLSIGSTASHAAGYAFKNIADDSGPFHSFSSDAPAINDVGTVAFRAELDDGSVGIFTGNGGPTATIADGIGSFDYGLSINNAGTVAFRGYRAGVGLGIFTGNGGPITTIAREGDQFEFAGVPFLSVSIPSMNDAGVVAFAATDLGIVTGVFTGSSGPLSTIADSSELFAGLGGDPFINDAGTVAFYGYYDNTRGLFTGSGGPITTIAVGSATRDFVSAPAINNAGTVAFRELQYYVDPSTIELIGQSISTGSGGLITTVADSSGPFDVYVFGEPAINAAGTVAFLAGLDAGGLGIFTGDDPVADRIIAVGDPLFGSTVTDLYFFRGLNDRGDVAFRYELANGSSGIAVAAVPEPASVVLFVTAALGLTLCTCHRHRRRAMAIRIIAAASGVLLVWPGPADAAMFDASTVAELVAAINATNQNADPDSINLAPGVTFTLTIPENETNGPTGLPTIAAGRELSIFGNGAVIERSAAMETPTFRLFDVAAGAALRLENLTLQGGHLYGEQVLTDEASAKGGAIFNQGDLALHNVTVEDNMAVGLDGSYARGYSAAGGGIYSSGSLTMQGGAVQNNLAQGGLGGVAWVGVDGATPGGPGGHGWGGGLYIADGTSTLNDVTFSANSAQGGVGGRGATVQNHGTRISTPGGRGGDGSGGGLFVADGAITLYDGAVTNNLAAAGAGGMGGPGPPPGAHGADGLTRGGGLFIEDESTTSLDEFTFTHVTGNSPSNFYGPFEILPNQVPGDYNDDSRVDAADYTVWRDGLGSTYTMADYDVWKSHFGESAGSGAAGYPLGASAAPLSPAIPEPSLIGLLAIAPAAYATIRYRRTNRRHRQTPHN